MILSYDDIKKYNKKQKKNTFFISFTITAILSLTIIYIVLMPHKVQGSSMDPTLRDKDIVFSISPRLKQYQRGDIVLINSVLIGKNIVKRIIAVGEDTVVIRGNKVYVNGNELNEPFCYRPQLNEDYLKTTQYSTPDISVKVPRGYIFVLGDNRDVSNDSRYFGCISEAEINGIYLFHIN